LKEAGGFLDFIDVDPNSPLKKNIIASNSNIYNEFTDVIVKKNIE
jgi:hypothetical protein